MSAEILILPVVRKFDRDSDSQSVLVKLTNRDYSRLTKIANQWNVSQDEAASMMLSRELDPRARK